MRLTLRTMLAYLDDILEPEDHQDIGRKIEESEFATSLVHKIRDVSRRMRLAAPKVAGRGMGLDPNTVAEYLDNTLTGERVPDFEKVCLESDVHLAEVASCHQILALVQVQPAEVNPELRQRMYGMAARAHERASTADDRGEPAHPAAAAALATAGKGPPELPPHAARPKPEVPEYLRSSSSSRMKPIMITIVLLLCLIGAVLLADKTNYISRLIFGEPKETAQNNKPPATTTTAAPVSTTTAATATTGSADVATSTTGTTPAPFVAGTIDKPGPATSGTSGAADRAGPDDPVKKPVVAPDSAKGPNDAVKAATDRSTPEGPAVVTPDNSNPLPPGPPDLPRPVDQGSPPGDGQDKTKPAVPALSPDAAGPVPADNGDQRIGRLISDKDVVLRIAAGQAEWQRIGAGVAFSAGDKLLVLPTYRPTVTLAAGATLQLAPETLVEFVGVERGIPVVRVAYGRMVLMTTGKPDVKIKLVLGPASGVLNFDDAEANVGIEVRPFQLPGVDPERNKPQQAVGVYCINGDVSWLGDGGNVQKLHAPVKLALSDDPSLGGRERDAKWPAPEPVSPLDDRASKALSESLNGKNSVSQTLLELYHKDHYVTESGLLSGAVENKSLAARSLALIDEFEPLVRLLGDPAERAVWRTQVQSLKAALARGPAVAAKVRAAFEDRGKDGDELYRMLWGYAAEDLSGGAAAKLVEYLDNDSLEVRVLAFYTLLEITHADFSYRPEQTAASRQQPIRRFKERLKEGAAGAKPVAAARPPLTVPEPRTAPADTEPGVPPAGPAPTKTPPPPLPTPDNP